MSFRVRTITAGVTLSDPADLQTLARAGQQLARAKDAFEAAGYEVQTRRVVVDTTQGQGPAASPDRLLAGWQALDEAAAASNLLLGVGPIGAIANLPDTDRAEWIEELAKTTRVTSISVTVASPEAGIDVEATELAARCIVAIATATPAGSGNFRFAAAASIPAGTPFFPVAWHRGPDSLAIGLESAPLVEEAFGNARDAADATACLTRSLDQALAPVAQIGEEVASREGLRWLGIDPSPAPLGDRSIAAGIEALTRVPFGSASTLRACAAVTSALRALNLKTCGYAGLMLPVLEDQVLARRAGEGRFRLTDLLLYSAVCGTGLDVVPLAGDVDRGRLAALIRDMATLAVTLKKPLSARLYPVPGTRPGDLARFDDPLLTDCVVFGVD